MSDILETPEIFDHDGETESYFELHCIKIKSYTLFCKNMICKNIEAEIYLKFKSVMRMFRSSTSNQHQNLFLYLHK